MTSPEGYIYCLSNPTHPDIFKIGITFNTPEERCKILSSDTGVVFPFKIEFAKKVKDPRFKETKIHSFLNAKRVNPKREFFREPLDQIKTLFDLMDGEYWSENIDTDIGDANIPEFKDGQRVRHRYGDDYWIGVYDSTSTKIVHNGQKYSASGFGTHHIMSLNPDRTTYTSPGWKACERELADGSWIKVL